jgi:hypothetical protein
MSTINFNNSEEQVSSVKPFLKAGIHDLLINDMYFNPAGPNIKGLLDYKGNIIQHKFDMALIDVTVVKTHAGGDSEKANGTVSFFAPEMKGDDKDSKRIDRLFHILVNMTSSDKKEKYKEWLKSQNKSFPDLVNAIGAMLKGKNKQVRYLLSAKDGKGAYLPNFFGGFAEPSDVDYANTTLKWDDAKMGNIKKDASAVEDALPPADYFAGSYVDPFADTAVDEDPFL